MEQTLDERVRALEILTDELKEEISKLKAKGTERKHKFEKSPYYDKNVFYNKAISEGWSESEIKKYYQDAEAYSKANGARYLNWFVAVSNWRRRDIEKQTPIKTQSKLDKILNL